MPGGRVGEYIRMYMGVGMSGQLRAANEERAEEARVDRELVKRVQKGDQAAFNVLVTKYQFRVGHLVGRYLNDSPDVEDVVQEAFIKAYRAIGGFRGDSAFYTWIYRIAINTAKNHLVALGRRPPASDVDATIAEMTDAGHNMRDVATPEGHYRTAELTGVIQQALDALPTELRDAIVFREIDGLSYDEIAEKMECPIGTIRSRIFRARESLDKAIRGITDDDQ